MSELLGKIKILVQPNLDMVSFGFGSHSVLVPYQNAFEIVRGIRAAAKLAMRHERTASGEWREISGIEGEEDPPVATHHCFRRSQLCPNFKQWTVRTEGSLVSLYFDDVSLAMHYEDMLKIHVKIRRAAKDAKAWAGDKGRKMRVTATLTDAEENYKYGYN